MKKHEQILAGILIVQIILIAVVFWPKSSATAASEPIFPDLESDDIVSLTIADADGNSVTLRQVAGEWVLPDADDYPVTEDNVTSLAEKLVALSTDRLVTRTDASHKQLQVAPDTFVRRIEFETTDGAKRILYLGSSPNYGAAHFRLEGESETYLTSDISTVDANATAASWVETTYVNVPQNDIVKMTLENTNGTFVFTRETAPGKEAGTWTMEGLAADETLSDTRVTAAVRQAAWLNMTRPLGKENKPAYGMDEPSAVATIETADRTVTLRIGAQDPEDNSYVAISSESPYYVRVAEFSVQNLVENAREDFLEVPTTPTPEGESDTS
jgi:hypothetical protein